MLLVGELKTELLIGWASISGVRRGVKVVTTNLDAVLTIVNLNNIRPVYFPLRR